MFEFVKKEMTGYRASCGLRLRPQIQRTDRFVLAGVVVYVGRGHRGDTHNTAADLFPGRILDFFEQNLQQNRKKYEIGPRGDTTRQSVNIYRADRQVPYDIGILRSSVIRAVIGVSGVRFPKYNERLQHGPHVRRL